MKTFSEKVLDIITALVMFMLILGFLLLSKNSCNKKIEVRSEVKMEFDSVIHR